jgi:hypothetical protein
VHRSMSAASFWRDSLQPSSLSSGRIPFGMSSQRIVTSTGGVGDAHGHSHLATKSRILRLEFNDFHNLLVGDQFDKSSWERVCVFGSFATQGVLRSR